MCLKFLMMTFPKPKHVARNKTVAFDGLCLLSTLIGQICFID